MAMSETLADLKRADREYIAALKAHVKAQRTLAETAARLRKAATTLAALVSPRGGGDRP